MDCICSGEQMAASSKLLFIKAHSHANSRLHSNKSISQPNSVNNIESSEKNHHVNKNATSKETEVDIISFAEAGDSDSNYVVEQENVQFGQIRIELTTNKTNQHTTYAPTDDGTGQHLSSLSVSDNINLNVIPGVNSSRSVAGDNHTHEPMANQRTVLHRTEAEEVRNHVNNRTDEKELRSYITQTSEGPDLKSSSTLFTFKQQSELEIIHPKQIRPIDLPGSDNAVELVAKSTERQTLSTVLDSQEKHRLRVACYQRPVIQLCHTKTEYKNGHHLVGMSTPQLTWYYDPVEMTCQHTSDCILNGNAFATRAECERVCIPISGARKCLAPPKAGYFQCSEQGPSRTVVPILMVFFDKTTGKCLWFTYYGCGGTANRFQSIAECQATCNHRVASKIFTGQFFSLYTLFAWI
ncbi:uncharacterized protein DEA37_0000279 [Paragonimus westermani]|uniref:BPTI/Kunitz inhibitor domain-containing protein n=1 Tax=Paragonimus westermani TaxID=34504 RepID=A0A5J4NLJ4_9TREM|nr:uncharacterized protein DEA37_0000279 [Paragonimus westermani]